MDVARIATLLAPYLAPQELTNPQLEEVGIYIDLLVRWNAKMNLTSVRDPDQIVQRHFGESFFLATRVLGDDATLLRAVDIGSGAGFPGLPVKIFRPEVTLTLVEAQYRKAIFLREVARALKMTGVEVLSCRAEELADRSAGSADVVTLRAVERFADTLPVAARFVRDAKTSADHGRLALLIGADQASRAATALPTFKWEKPLPLPGSDHRILLVGRPGDSYRGQSK